MSGRRTARLALHWAVTTFVAAIASIAAAIPFTGPAANVVGVVVIAGVCLIGYACAPHPGDAR